MSNEYRCTRPDVYSNPNCPGHKDVTARQGHYIEANSEGEAIEKMKKKFPKDSRFDIQLWAKQG